MSSEAGYRGIFVISLSQTELDGVWAPSQNDLAIGSVWRWQGEAVRVDGSSELLLLDGGAAAEALRFRAARSARRYLGSVKPARTPSVSTPDTRPLGRGFRVTDGLKSYEISVLTEGAEGGHLAIAGELPPRHTDLFVTDHTMEAQSGTNLGPSGVICFTPGTSISTPNGARLVEEICPGDMVSTRDDGAQEVLWVGTRRMTGARLYAHPHLRPVRIRAGAMGEDRPETDLIVSPGHRMLVSGARAQALFNQSEVLVAARDLIDDQMVLTETGLRDVTYVHLLTSRHQILWANGLEAESFHPANADLDLLDPQQRIGLEALLPDIEGDPFSYGDYARRNLTTPEAAILRYAAV
ncbi:MAG: Hint domain-containing protein [Albidovulum sp.]